MLACDGSPTDAVSITTNARLPAHSSDRMRLTPSLASPTKLQPIFLDNRLAIARSTVVRDTCCSRWQDSPRSIRSLVGIAFFVKPPSTISFGSYN